MLCACARARACVCACVCVCVCVRVCVHIQTTASLQPRIFYLHLPLPTCQKQINRFLYVLPQHFVPAEVHYCNIIDLQVVTFLNSLAIKFFLAIMEPNCLPQTPTKYLFSVTFLDICDDFITKSSRTWL
jgi:hypothetical protein